MRFEDLRLSKPLLDAVHHAGYEQPTPIQVQAIPLILAGKDVVGSAQTGTGKTAAFALPILQNLSARPARREPSKGRAGGSSVRALVLSPTRELAEQIYQSFATYGRQSGLRPAVVYGGVSKHAQTRVLRGRVDILVATPGRLLDHLADGAVDLSKIEILVLDEADRMLDMGFLPDVRRILARLPGQRQSLLFSATMPEPIRRLAANILRQPVSVEVARVSSAAPLVEHWAYHVEKAGKAELLARLLEHTPFSRALVFTRTKHGADRVVKHLERSGTPAAAIHGNKSQGARTRALADFRTGKTSVLVATDLAARGLDVDDISHVINYDLTAEPETYVHRIGRTGRAGATGKAFSFVSSEDHGSLRDIERLLRMSLQPASPCPAYTPTKPASRPPGHGRPGAGRPSTPHPAAGRGNRPQQAARPRQPGSDDFGGGADDRRRTRRRRTRRRSPSVATT